MQSTLPALALGSVTSAQLSGQSSPRRASGADPIHQKFIRQAIEIASSARKNGNHPFGALLVDGPGRVMITAENTVLTKHDPTRHAELNLVQVACDAFPSEALSKATLYTSTEPCVMCCGAIHWAGIPSVVYGCSARTLGKSSNQMTFFSLAVRPFEEQSSRASSWSDQYSNQKRSSCTTGFGIALPDVQQYRRRFRQHAGTCWTRSAGVR